MHRRQPLPRLWLFTDERGGDPVASLRAMPKGSGVVFRHHHLPPRARRALFERVQAEARRRRAVVLLADRPSVARAWGADGAHHRSMLRSIALRSVPVHNMAERRLAERVGADLVFVSPVFATRSHPHARGLGVVRLGLLLRGANARAFALGGLNRQRFQRLKGLNLGGWGAIDALSSSNGQNLNAVPT